MTDERYVSPCPPLTDRQQEIATIAMEECAEIIKRLSKMARFGINEIQPGQEHTNTRRLSFEIGDLSAMIPLLVDEGMIDYKDVTVGYEHKKKQLAKFMQTQPQAPVVREKPNSHHKVIDRMTPDDYDGLVGDEPRVCYEVLRGVFIMTWPRLDGVGHAQYMIGVEHVQRFGSGQAALDYRPVPADFDVAMTAMRARLSKSGKPDTYLWRVS